MEQAHAYDALDLPLLNRFEKQILTAETLLDPNQRLVLADLQRWIEDVLDETSLRSYQQVFCGFHDKTLPSLILSQTEFGGSLESMMSSAMDRMRGALAGIATPAAVQASGQLQAAAGSDYFETHQDIQTVFQDVVRTHAADTAAVQTTVDAVELEAEMASGLRSEHEEQQQQATDAAGVESTTKQVEAAAALGAAAVGSRPSSRLVDSMLAVVMTSSPVSHMGLAIPAGVLQLGGGGVAAISCVTMEMSEISSEAALAKDLLAFFRDEAPEPRCCVISADPLTSSQLLIEHVRHVVVQQREQFDREVGGGGAANGGDVLTKPRLPARHVMLIVHLPPGIVSRARHYVLDFYTPWVYRFVDDLRPTTSGHGGGSVRAMLSQPISQLASVDLASVSSLIRLKCHAITSMCLQPHLEPTRGGGGPGGPAGWDDPSTKHSYARRIELLKQLSADEEFVGEVVGAVRGVLAANDFVGPSGLHPQAEIALGQAGAKGSLRQSLEIAIEQCVERAVAATLRQLDVDFNLHHAAAASKSRALFFALVQSGSELIVSPLLASGCLLADSAAENSGSGAAVPNSGKGYGPIAGRFPFSSRIIPALQTAGEALVAAGTAAAGLQAGCRQAAVGMFGPELVAALEQHTAAEPTAYLHDFVGSVPAGVPGLTLQAHAGLLGALLECIQPAALASPWGVHSSFAAGCRHAELLCGLIGGLESDNLTAHATAALSKLAAASAGSSAGSSSDRLALSCMAVAEEVLQFLWSQQAVSTAMDTVATAAGWVHRVDSVSEGLGELLAELVDATGHRRAVLSLQGLRTAAIVLHEAVRPAQGFIDAVGKLARSFEPTVQFITSLCMELVGQQQHGGDAATAAVVLRRFVAEIIFGAGGAGRDDGSLDAELLALLTALVEGRWLGPAGGCAAVAQSVPLRRTLLHCLLFAGISPILAVEPAATVESAGAGPTGLRLLAELLEDTAANSPSAELPDLLVGGFTAKALSAAHGQGGEALCEFMRRAALAKHAVHAYIGRLQLLVTAMAAADRAEEEAAAAMELAAEPGMEEHEPAAEPAAAAAAYTVLVGPGGAPTTVAVNLLSAELLALDGLGRAIGQDAVLAVYTNKVAVMTGGVKFVLDLAANRHLVATATPWFRFDRSVLTTTTASDLIDPFSDWDTTEVGRADSTRLATAVQGRRACPRSGRAAADAALSQAVRKVHGKRKELLAATLYTQGFLTCELRTVQYSGRFGVVQYNLAELTDEPADITKMMLHRADLKYPANTKFSGWVGAGCPVWLPLGPLAQPLHQIVFHAGLLGWSKPGSWAHLLLFTPDLLAADYIPSMPMDELSAVMAGLESHGLQWYRCPRGHPYTVGECGKPMQSAKCAQCGAPIGGNNHVSAHGNTSFKKNEAEVMAGYIANATTGRRCDVDIRTEVRLSQTTVRVLRLLIHSLMLVGMQMTSTFGGDMESFHTFLSGTVRTPYGNTAAAGSKKPTRSKKPTMLAARLLEDWETLAELHSLSDDDLSVALNLVLRAARKLEGNGVWVGHFPSHGARCEFEHGFQTRVVEPIFADVANAVQEARSALGGSSQLVVVEKGFGKAQWQQLREDDTQAAVPGAPQPQQPMVWALRQPACLPHFRRSFEAASVNFTAHRLLDLFLKEEGRLAHIKYIVDILSWHAVLFSVFAAGGSAAGLSRKEAAELTNGDAIERLPVGQQRTAAEGTLSRYCDGFNKAFPSVRLLYECTPNPFLSRDGTHVDLSGAEAATPQQAVPMRRGTPLSFSLPFKTHGEVDAPGLCTVALLGLLSNTHNDLLLALQDGAGGVGGAEEGSVAVFGCTSSMSALSRRLIMYDRTADLEPLLTAYANRSNPAGESAGGKTTGLRVAYDFGAVERALGSSALLAGKTPVAVHVRNFPYVGELGATGVLTALEAKIPQEELPAAILQSAFDEIDTEYQLSRLTGHLESAARFLAAAPKAGHRGGPGLEQSKLAEYMLHTLQVDPAGWAEASTRTINEVVRLAHLRSLLMAVEERTHGSKLDTVLLKYREPLEPGLADSLRAAAAAGLVVAELLPVVRDFMVEQLTADSCPAEASLKQYLEYAALTPLDEQEWYVEHFPEGLQIRHTWAVFAHLSAERNGAA